MRMVIRGAAVFLLESRKAGEELAEDTLADVGRLDRTGRPRPPRRIAGLCHWVTLRLTYEFYENALTPSMDYRRRIR